MTTLDATIRDAKVQTINELIQATRDSAAFYQDASTHVDNPQLKSLFVEMAQSKNGLVGSMAKEVLNEGATPAASGTFGGAWRQFYSNVKLLIASDKGDYEYVKELKASEDRLLDVFHDVIKDEKAPKAVKAALNSYLPTVIKQHDIMRDRKWAMQASH